MKVRREQAETDLAVPKVLDAQVELMNKLKGSGLVLRQDERGNLSIDSSTQNELPPV
jgi:hypothetical protein